MPPPTPIFASRQALATELGEDLRTLTGLAWGLAESRRYYSFQIPKRRPGELREIDAPIKPLRRIQEKIRIELEKGYRPPPYVHGFVPERGIMTNAKHHKKKSWLLKMDVKDFFPSINFSRVRGMLMAKPFYCPFDVAVLIAQLCCRDGILPQGSPASPVISNLICRKLDSEMGRLASRARCSYTRYADDMTFSSDRANVPEELVFKSSGRQVELAQRLVDVVGSNGFVVHDEKTRLLRRGSRQRTTGLVVNEHVNVPREFVRGTSALIHIWRKFNRDDAEASYLRNNPGALSGRAPHKREWEFVEVLRGRVQYIGMVRGWSDPVYSKLADRLEDLDEGFKRKIDPVRRRVKLFTEGESDINHLLAAQEYFHSKGEFEAFELAEVNDSNCKSAESVLDRAKGLALSTQYDPCFCVLDTDVPGTLTKAGITDSDRWVNLGNDVIVMALAGSTGVLPDPFMCIELIYPKKVLETLDEAGRRVFLREEFNSRTGHHQIDPNLTIPNARIKTLVCEEVHEVGSGEKNVALTKADFSKQVRRRAKPYAAMDFECFRPTFERMAEALESTLRRNG